MIKQFAIFGIIGITMEVLWTGLGSLFQREFKLTSHTSIWMFFIYGIACFIGPVSEKIASRSLFTRGLIYCLCIFAVEYISGILLKSAGMCPWDYSGARYSINGIIRLDYAPVWFSVGLIFEYIHKHLAFV